MKHLPFLLSFLLSFVGMAQSPLPSTKTFSVITGTNGILTGASTNFFAINTNLLFRATAGQVNGTSNSLVAALIATNSARIGDINATSNYLNGAILGVSSGISGTSNSLVSAIQATNTARVGDITTSSNYLSGLISSLTTSANSSIAFLTASVTGLPASIATSYNAAIASAQNTLNSLTASRSVNSIADLLATRTDSLSGTTNITVFVRGYFATAGDGGGTFHLVPTNSLPADITGTNRGTCFATTDSPTVYWVRRDRRALNVRDFGAKSDGSTNDEIQVQDAMNATQEITFPAGTTTYMGTYHGAALNVPANRLIHIRGTVSGPNYWVFAGSVVVDGGGLVSLGYDWEPRKMQFFGGDVYVRDLNFVGVGGGWAINISKDAVMNSFHVDRCRFENMGSGVIRENNAMSSPNTNIFCHRGRVTGSVFTNMFIGGVAWEPNLADGSVELTGNRLDNIHFLWNGSNGFGGFALSVAGWSADNWGNETNQIHLATIKDNTITRARYGIHAEYYTDVVVSGNRFADMDESYVTTTGGGLVLAEPLTTTCVEMIGVQRFTVAGNYGAKMSSTQQILGVGAFFAGGFDGPQAPVDRYTIANNVFETGDIYAELQLRAAAIAVFQPMPIGTIKGNVLHAGSLRPSGRGQWNILDNYARAPWGKTAFVMNFTRSWNANYTADVRFPVVIKNNTAVNPIGTPSFSFSEFEDLQAESNLSIQASGNNFPVSSPSQKGHNAGTVFWSTNGVPFGQTFSLGDVIMDQSQRPPRPIIITASGSRTVPGDYCNAQPSTNAVRGVVGSAVYNWLAGGYHQAGQLVHLLGTPAPVDGLITDIYLDAPTSYVVARLVDPATGNPLNLTGFTPGLMQAGQEVGFTVQGFGTLTWDPASVAAGGSIQLSGITVLGALPGDIVQASFSLDTQGMILTGAATANDLCRVTLFNPTGGAIDLASGTLRISTTTAR